VFWPGAEKYHGKVSFVNPTWRFVRRCCGRVDGVWGKGVFDEEGEEGWDDGTYEPKFGRFLRGEPLYGMQETPTNLVFRHPNWGFLLDSCYSVHTSWRMPPLGLDPMLEDDALLMTTGNMWEEVQRFKKGQHIDSYDRDPIMLTSYAAIAEQWDAKET